MFNKKVITLLILIVGVSILDLITEVIQFVPIIGDILGIISEVGLEAIQLTLVALLPFAVSKK